MFSIKKNVYKYLLPNLLETQRISFCWFLELGFIQELENFSAIRDYLDELELNLSSKLYTIRQPKYTLAEAKRRDTTYSVRIYTRAQLLYLNDAGSATENEVLLCDIPLMTNERFYFGCSIRFRVRDQISFTLQNQFSMIIAIRALCLIVLFQSFLNCQKIIHIQLTIKMQA